MKVFEKIPDSWHYLYIRSLVKSLRWESDSHHSRKVQSVTGRIIFTLRHHFHHHIKHTEQQVGISSLAGAISPRLNLKIVNYISLHLKQFSVSGCIQTSYENYPIIFFFIFYYDIGRLRYIVIGSPYIILHLFAASGWWLLSFFQIISFKLFSGMSTAVYQWSQ